MTPKTPEEPYPSRMPIPIPPPNRLEGQEERIQTYKMAYSALLSRPGEEEGRPQGLA